MLDWLETCKDVHKAMTCVPSPEQREAQQFLDHAVHDLRAVLRKIGTSVEILCENRSGDASSQHIMEGVARAAAILEGISLYSTALGVASSSFTRMKLEVALKAALQSIEARIQETGAEVTHGPLPEVTGDKDRLTDLFRILLSNALTYRSVKPPKVEIEAHKRSEEWVLSVRDNGIGVAPKYQERLFEPFYRLHGSEIPGVGLGLAIGRKLVEAHRGRIWIESEAEKGATFFVALPVPT